MLSAAIPAAALLISNDMYAESSNDEYKGYAQIATQMDFNAFGQLEK